MVQLSEREGFHNSGGGVINGAPRTQVDLKMEVDLKPPKYVFRRGRLDRGQELGLLSNHLI